MVNATYTIEFESDKLTWELCKLADRTISSGMIEEALDGVVSFHDLKGRDIGSALKFIEKNFNKPRCCIAVEHINGCFCRLEYI